MGYYLGEFYLSLNQSFAFFSTVHFLLEFSLCIGVFADIMLCTTELCDKIIIFFFFSKW